MIAQSIFCPCCEFTPVIFWMLPEDFDHVEFRAVGRDEAEEGVMRFHPAQGNTVVEAVMDSSVIEDDKSRGILLLGNLRNQVVHEFDKGFTVDRDNHLIEAEMLAGKVQCAHDRHPLMEYRQGGMMAAHWRLGALHWRQRTNSSFIVVEQLSAYFVRPSFQIGKLFLAGVKSEQIPLFFRLVRIRLKLKPRALSIFPTVSSVAGSAH